MTQDEIIDMARQVIDLNTDKRGRNTFLCDEYGLEAFAKLVAQHEREACAKVCDDLDQTDLIAISFDSSFGGGTLACAKAIRARGSQ